MKTLAFLVLLCLIYSCKSKTERLKAKLLPVIEKEVNTLGLHKIDSLKILTIDTISDSLYAQLRQNAMYFAADNYAKIANQNSSRSVELVYQAREAYNAAHMELYTPDESTFRQEQMDVYHQRQAEASDYSAKCHKYLDSVNMALAEIKRLDKILVDKKTNKKNLLGYYVEYYLSGADDDNHEVKFDTLRLCISPSMRVMKIDQF
jgi:hypothetical protein